MQIQNCLKYNFSALNYIHQRDNDEKLDSLKLVNYLDKYAETGQKYIDVLKQIIKQNSLTDFDDVNVMPTSNKTKKLI